MNQKPETRNRAEGPTPSLSQRLKKAMNALPFVAADLPGIGGVLKAKPEHFKVEEVLPYAPCGEGEHLFVSLRRTGWNTADVARELTRAFDLKRHDIGWGGRKDKHAVTTQTFSLRLPLSMPLRQAEAMLKTLPFEIVMCKRHGNKLKTGHVAGNRFDIILSQVSPEDIDKALAIDAFLKRNGLPNYYGEQRFGHQMRNIDRAAALIENKGKSRGRKDAFTVSVLQSALFNYWLKARIERGHFNSMLAGDVARKTDTGGLFIVDDLKEAAQRFAAHQIVYTGPIYGYKMMSAADEAGDFESQVPMTFDINLQRFKNLKAPGTRRAALIYPDDLTIAPDKSGLRFNFSLPSGAYATTVLREFMRLPIEKKGD